MTRRIDAGPLLVLVGALLLLVSLFMDWYEPRLTAWEVFEVLDLLLAVLAAAAIVLAATVLGIASTGSDARWLPWIAGAALVLVLGSLLDRPPVVGEEADADVGLWLALAGAAVMLAGAVLTGARVSLSLAVEPRERQRVAAVDARTEPLPASAPPAPAPAAADETSQPTQPQSLMEDPVDK